MKSARFLIVVLLFVLGVAGCASPTYRQRPERRTFRVSGYVLDSVSRQPVAGVFVQDENWGMVFSPARTDASGHFVLRLPYGRRKVVKQAVVRTTLYEGQAVIPTDTTQRITLLLKRNAYRFKPYGCQRPADSVYISPYATMPFQQLPGSQIAFLIRDSTARPPHKLRSITLKVGQDGVAQEPFRLRIYKYNGQVNTPPGEDLLPESITVCPVKKEVFTYDVSAYDITVSGTGFFLAVEYLTGANKSFCNDPVTGYTPIGPVLRPPCARADIRTWEYVIGKGWHRATAVENCWPLYESALSVEVEPAPAKR